MRPIRVQAPTSFQKRWPRVRRQKALKGVPEVKTHDFVYHLMTEPALIKEQFQRDVRRMFPQGDFTITRFNDGLRNAAVFHVTQTKAQRRMV